MITIQLGKEKIIDILKDQHPYFNQSASNGVLVSFINENTCSGCTAFKVFISILFIVLQIPYQQAEVRMLNGDLPSKRNL